MLIIPYHQLSIDALRGLVEEFVTRDGTELTTAERKIEQVIKALEQGQALIYYDEDEQTTDIRPIDTPHEQSDKSDKR